MNTHRRHWRLIARIGLLSLALAHGAPARTADFKVGFVNVSLVLDRAPQAARARNKLEEEFAPRDQEILVQQQRIKELDDDLRKNSAVLSASELDRQTGELRRLKRELRRSQEEFREELNLRRSEELSALQRMVTEVIQAMASEENYDLIITGGVVFAGERVNITQRVLERLESAHKESDG